MSIALAAAIILLLRLGSIRPMFRFLAALAFTFECVIFREKAFVIESGLSGLLFLVIGASVLFLYDKITQNKKG
jgi:hypothetical protein